MKELKLPSELAQQIDRLCKQGDDLMDTGDYLKAAQKYIDALRLLPRPIEQWEVTPHLAFFWGLAYFKAKKWDTAVNSFASALAYASHADDPNVHLHIGMAYHNDHKPRKGKMHLSKAFELGGCEVFHGVEDVYLEIATSNPTETKKIVRPAKSGSHKKGI